jgi:serine protease
MKKLLFAACLLTACSHSNYSDDAVTGEIVVDFADDVSDDYVAELGKKLNISFKPESDYSSVDRIYVGEYMGDDESDVLDKLNHDSNVEAADPDYIYTIPEHNLSDERIPADVANYDSGFPNDPLYKDQWHMRQIHLPSNWKDGPSGKNVIVAVIDTGSSQLSDFKQTNFMPCYNFVKNNKDARDDHGHGTHVAGTIAESTNNGVGGVGVAYRATIMPIKVLSAEGSGTLAAITQGIRWAADHGADVINMSLGGGGYSKTMANAVKYAHDKGVVVVCAAGNSSTSRPSYPAAYPGAIAVAATQDDERVTFYSNWGKHIAIAAPGGNTRNDKRGGVLQNTIDDHGEEGYFYFMGTSMASPHIAGIAALIVGEGIERKPDTVLKILTETARSPSGMENDKPKDYSEHYGAGIVDASKAVQRAHEISKTRTSHKIKTTLFVLLALGIGIILFVRKKKK